MVRIGERREPARPTTDEQQARSTAILTAAARLGRAKPIDRIAAQEIATEAGVALRTLYRYYPSKYHVYAAVLTARVQRLGVPEDRPEDPADAVADLMADACRNVLRHRHLAHAMITSTQFVRAQRDERQRHEHAVRDVILATAGVEHPTSEQIRVARLIEQVTFGVLTWTVGGELDVESAVVDVRLACRSLIGHGFGAARD